MEININYILNRGHLTGIEPEGKKGCSIFGTSYAKSSAISIKGNYNKDFDIPPEDLTIHKKNFIVPKMRSKEDMGALKRENELIEETKNSKKYFDKLKVRKLGKEGIKINCELSEGFKNAVNRKKVNQNYLILWEIKVLDLVLFLMSNSFRIIIKKKLIFIKKSSELKIIHQFAHHQYLLLKTYTYYQFQKIILYN